MTSALDVPSGRPAEVPTPSPGDPRLARCSLNHWTVRSASLPELVRACLDTGIPAVGLWRDETRVYGVSAARRLVDEAGLRVSSLCRGGFLTAPDADGRMAAIASNRDAVEEAAALDAGCLVMVVGGLPPASRDLPGSRARVVELLDEIVPLAESYGVRLALEPMHPMYCADRAVLSTLGQAIDVAERYPVATVGVVVDAFHVWWDPDLEAQIARAGERIASFQICDWITPLPADALLARGMPGDGHIDLARLSGLVAAAGYRGDIETEVFNADVWAAPVRDVAATVARRHVQLVG